MKSNLYTAIIAVVLFSVGTGYGFAQELPPSIEPAPVNKVPNEQAPLQSEKTFLFYTVRPGDSLYRIARIYDITIATLKKANNLENTIIRVGQQLHIPMISDSMATAAIALVNDAIQGDDDSKDHPLRFRLVETGIGMLGIKYRRGGVKESGFDCSGLVKNLFSRFNIELPRSSRQQYRLGQEVDRDKLEIGDLVFFSSSGKQPTHVGIYIGENKFLHAALKAQKVVISDLNKTWYAVRYLGARRIMDLWKDEQDSDPQGG
jgi:cell wall-associated NlpC family hydrolase